MFTDEQVLVLVDKAVEAGYKFFTEKKYLEAELILMQALKVNPDNFTATQLMGLMRHNQGRFEEGIEFFSRNIEWEPGNAESHNNISLCYSNLGDFGRAEPHMRKAVELAPECNYMHANLGLLCRKLQRIEEAKEHYKKALSLKDEDANTWCMLGGCYGEQQNLQEAEKCFKKAIEIDPDFSAAHIDLASVYHLMGEEIKAWGEYEWRFECFDQTKFWLKLYDHSKRWYGEELEGMRIMLHTEQGVGDLIHFFRYVPIIKKMGAYVIVHCQEEMKSLVAPHVDEVYTEDPAKIPLFADRPEDHPMPKYDYFASIVSLPYLLQNPPIPKTPYFFTDKTFSLDNYSDYIKVGIVWAGNPMHPNDIFRSCRLSRFRTLHDLPQVKLFSLQKDKRPRQYRFMPTPVDLTEGSEGMRVVDLSDYMDTFEDTAAILKSLDLLVTVDTSVLHLAGSMNIPTWGLIPYNTDWRWGLRDEKTKWYPSVRLFRQPALGDWDSVFERVVQTFKEEYYV